jgi:putative phosphoribosyl transferase
MRFKNRTDAGRHLAGHLAHLRGEDVVVVGLPRGGVPVAAEVARRLGAPLDVVVVRKLGVPFQPELAMGAIGEGGTRVLNEDVLRDARVTDQELAAVEAEQRTELTRRARRFRGERPRIPIDGRVVVVVDDGIATGSTARAACAVVRSEGASRVVLAVPVAPPDWTRRLAGVADELVCVATPEPFYAVGQFYDDFTQTSDDEVVDYLRGAFSKPLADPPQPDCAVRLTIGGATLDGQLVVPAHAEGVVLFAHGSGSSRHSARNRYVSSVLNDVGLATLLFDLLTPSEEVDRSNVFDVGLLARRLIGVTGWFSQNETTGKLPLGYFGASTGAGAALLAAARLGNRVGAVVSRGGRPDLAAPELARVTAPTLLIVGGLDRVVLDLNRTALAELRCERRLAIVPGATHLFDEPGTLLQAAELARWWFLDHLVETG